MRQIIGRALWLEHVGGQRDPRHTLAGWEASLVVNDRSE
jgi:hypothetical protein